MKDEFLIFSIASSFQKLSLKVYVKPGQKKSNVALILNPGAFESIWGDNNRYKKILLWFQKNLSYHPTIVSYETARYGPVSNANSFELREESWKKVFKRKTFNDELSDVKKVYRLILNIKKLSIRKIYTIGFSLGGTQALLLSSLFPQIKKICILGSAISTKRHYLPILKDYPKKKDILAKIKNYNNYLHIYQGFDEKIVPFKDAELIFSIMTRPTYINLTRIAGANHMFSAHNNFGLASYKSLLPQIKEFLELTL